MFAFLFKSFVMVSFGLAWLDFLFVSVEVPHLLLCIGGNAMLLLLLFFYFPFAEVLDGLHYQDSHEWVKVEGDVGIVGITDHAQVKCVKHHDV
jgi:hypothetical protein